MKSFLSSGIPFILTGVLGYACFPILVKFISQSGIDPVDIAIWRFTFAFPAIWLLIRGLRIPAPERPLPKRGLLLLGVVMVLAALAAFFGLQYLPASVYILLFYSYPAMVALMNLLRGEHLAWQTWLALGLILVGIALTLPRSEQALALGEQAYIGVVLAFVNAFFVALYFVMNQRLVRGNQAARRASAWTLTGAFIMMWLIALLRGVNLPPDLPTWGLLLALGLISTVMPVFLYTIGIQRLGASRAAMFSTVEPIGTTILAAIFLGERLEGSQLMGAGVILLSLLLLQMRRLGQPRPKVEAVDVNA
jgi:drug/metabolite transporter (DMT)-like permease